MLPGAFFGAFFNGMDVFPGIGQKSGAGIALPLI
jgi:hypothetical protein